MSKFSDQDMKEQWRPSPRRDPNDSAILRGIFDPQAMHEFFSMLAVQARLAALRAHAASTGDAQSDARID